MLICCLYGAYKQNAFKMSFILMGHGKNCFMHFYYNLLVCNGKDLFLLQFMIAWKLILYLQHVWTNKWIILWFTIKKFKKRKTFTLKPYWFRPFSLFFNDSKICFCFTFLWDHFIVIDTFNIIKPYFFRDLILNQIVIHQGT